MLQRVALGARRAALAGRARPSSAVRTLKNGRSLERLDSFIGVSNSKKGGQRSAEEAVNNILYNTPVVPEKPNRHIMTVMVDNEPGVLSKISGLLSARGFNIDSLTVSATDVKELSRMTIVLVGPDSQMEQAGRQLEDLCDVWAVVDHRNSSILQRELAIVKVSCVPPDRKLDTVAAAAGDPEAYTDMMQAHFHRQAILDTANMFGARVDDVGTESIILEIVSWSERVDAFIRILRPFGVIEAARSGVIAMNRAQVAGGDDGALTERAVIDIADLPPS